MAAGFHSRTTDDSNCLSFELKKYNLHKEIMLKVFLGQKSLIYGTPFCIEKNVNAMIRNKIKYIISVLPLF
jgi:hypothetical protein